jgi:hypothetical protein
VRLQQMFDGAARLASLRDHRRNVMGFSGSI